MLKIIFVFIIFIHGMIHLVGFAKAFHYGNITQLSRNVPKTAGMLWLLTVILFLIAGVLLLLKKDIAWLFVLPAVLLSQALIVTVWSDAKFGTIINGVLLVATMLAYGGWRFEKTYNNDVAINLSNNISSEELIREQDISHLPSPVQKYLTYVGVVGKPKVYNYKIVFEGQMREKGKDWFPFTSEQYNFTNAPTRLFFMKAKMFGVTVPGYHAYKNGKASMQIKVFGLFAIVNEKEGKLDKAETVTLFNDMCILAPAVLIDKEIQWQPIDSHSAKAIYTVQGITITATLYFNNEGQLINFVSDDRIAIADNKNYRFSTPVSDYKNFGGYTLPGYGEAVWHYPDGAFAYGRFILKEVKYNIR